MICVYYRNLHKKQPIVIQTPRGLHRIFKIPKNIKPKFTKMRSKVSRIGIRFEYIHHGNCALIGVNYRLINNVNLLTSLLDLPYPLWPVHQNTKNVIEYTDLIPIGNRYNTLMAGLQNTQFVYMSNGVILNWLNKYMVQKSDNEGLKPSEIGYLCEKAGSKWKKTVPDRQSPKDFDEVIPEG